MRRVWLIRSGDNAEVIDPMRFAGQIGLRFESVRDLGRITPAEIEQGLMDGGLTGVAALRATLIQFANDVHVGDLIVSPNNARREVWLGVVTGEYRHDREHPKVAGYQHVRDVDWLGWLDRDAVWMRDQQKSLDRPQTMYELPSREWWWRQVDSQEFGSSPRPVRSTPVPRSRASSGTPRAPRAAKPVTPARKPPVALVRCAGTCGFQWAPSSLVDGLCNDCRADL
ncbi:MAG: hypothetical protein ABIR32_11600 [Ilumatobacteraceae bacterium]